MKFFRCFGCFSVCCGLGFLCGVVVFLCGLGFVGVVFGGLGFEWFCGGVLYIVLEWLEMLDGKVVFLVFRSCLWFLWYSWLLFVWIM